MYVCLRQDFTQSNLELTAIPSLLSPRTTYISRHTQLPPCSFLSYSCSFVCVYVCICTTRDYTNVEIRTTILYNIGPRNWIRVSRLAVMYPYLLSCQPHMLFFKSSLKLVHYNGFYPITLRISLCLTLPTDKENDSLLGNYIPIWNLNHHHIHTFSFPQHYNPNRMKTNT